MIRRPLRSTLFPYTTLFRSVRAASSNPPLPYGRGSDLECDYSDDRVHPVFGRRIQRQGFAKPQSYQALSRTGALRSEEHTSELQSHSDLVCRLLLEKKNEKGGSRRLQNDFEVLGGNRHRPEHGVIVDRDRARELAALDREPDHAGRGGAQDVATGLR